MVDLTRGLRVLVVGHARGPAWLRAITSHGWQATLASASVQADAEALWPHAAVIDAGEVDEAAAAGLAVRAAGPYNAVLIFVTDDEALRRRIRSQVPAPTFATEKTYMGELWQLPQAREDV